MPPNPPDCEKFVAISSNPVELDESIQKRPEVYSEPVAANDKIDPDLVTWDGDNDPGNPYNWLAWRKWSLAALLSLTGLVTLMSGSMLAPALQDISRDLHTSEATANLILSIYVLAFAFGPMVLAPITEVYGRRPVWLACGIFYIIWNTVCGFACIKALMILGRILTGLGASVDFAVTIPCLADCWTPEERGKSFAIIALLPLFGPALGPIISGFITQNIGWRWVFWVVSIFEGTLIVVGFFLFEEPHAPTILRKRAKAIRKSRNPNAYTIFEKEHTKLSTKLTAAVSRPIRLLLTQPIIQFMACLLAINFGITYIVLTTFADLWISRYGQTVKDSGLQYIAVVIGYTIGAQGGARINDKIWAHLKSKAGGQTAPEYRVPLMIPGAIMLPVGLLWYGWAAQAKVHWIITDLGIVVHGCGIILSTQAMQAYVLDAFVGYTASASAASQVLRSIFGFVFPIFAPALYHRLGYGWGNSLLALVFAVLGLPAPLILWKYGKAMREAGGRLW